MHLLARRHRWKIYQRFIERLKKLMGPRLFYGIKNLPQTVLHPLYHQRHQRIRRQVQQRKKTILVIDHEIPCFNRSSGEYRMDTLLRLLVEKGYTVSLIAENPAIKPSSAERFADAGIQIVLEPALTHLKKKGASYGTVILCRPYIAEKYIHTVEKYAPGVSIVFDTVDLHHVRMQREATLTGNDMQRKKAEHMEEVELHLITLADCTLVVSETERAYVLSRLPQAKVITLSNIHEEVIPPHLSPGRQHLLFVGNFYHTPNEDGIRWFIKDILPFIHKDLPDVVLDIVGYGSDIFVKDLRSNSVLVHGHQPLLQPFFDHARVSIAPLRYGAGVKGKISMTMSEGVPCVTTPIGAEGMHLEHEKTVMIAETPEAFAAAVIRLYRNDALWMNIAQSAQEEGLKPFSKDAARSALSAMFDALHS